MSTQFEPASALSVGKGAVELDPSASIESSASQLVEKGGSEMGAEAVVAGQAALDTSRYRNYAVRVKTEYHVEVFAPNGALKWAEDFENLVTTAGLNALLDATFKSGAVSPTWFIGLVDGSDEPEFLLGDTLAEHEGWLENTDYAETERPAFTPGTILQGSVDNVDNRGVVSINADGKTIAGCFLASDDTKEGTEGTLYGVGTFTGGNREVDEGDTLRVTLTLSVSD